jgi:hypothetical protein
MLRACARVCVCERVCASAHARVRFCAYVAEREVVRVRRMSLVQAAGEGGDRRGQRLVEQSHRHGQLPHRHATRVIRAAAQKRARSIELWGAHVPVSSRRFLYAYCRQMVAANWGCGSLLRRWLRSRGPRRSRLSAEKDCRVESLESMSTDMNVLKNTHLSTCSVVLHVLPPGSRLCALNQMQV